MENRWVDTFLYNGDLGPNPGQNKRKHAPPRSSSVPGKKIKPAARASAGKKPGGTGGAGGGAVSNSGSILSCFSRSSTAPISPQAPVPQPRAPIFVLGNGFGGAAPPEGEEETHSFFRKFGGGSTTLPPTGPTPAPKPSWLAGALPTVEEEPGPDPYATTAIPATTSASTTTTTTTTSTTSTGYALTGAVQEPEGRTVGSGDDGLGGGGGGATTAPRPFHMVPDTEMPPPSTAVPPSLPSTAVWRPLPTDGTVKPAQGMYLQYKKPRHLFSAGGEGEAVPVYCLKPPREGGGSSTTGTDNFLVTLAEGLQNASSIEEQLELLREKGNIFQVAPSNLKMPVHVSSGDRYVDDDFRSLAATDHATLDHVLETLTDMCQTGKSLHRHLSLVTKSEPLHLIKYLAAMLFGTTVLAAREREEGRKARKAASQARKQEEAKEAADQARAQVIAANPDYTDEQIKAAVKTLIFGTNHLTDQTAHNRARLSVAGHAHHVSKDASGTVMAAASKFDSMIFRFKTQLGTPPDHESFEGVLVPFAVNSMFGAMPWRWEDDDDVEAEAPTLTPAGANDAAMVEGIDGQEAPPIAPAPSTTTADAPTPPRLDLPAARRTGPADPSERWPVPPRPVVVTGLVTAAEVHKHQQAVSCRMLRHMAEAAERLEASLKDAHAAIDAPGTGNAARIGSKDPQCKDATDLRTYRENIAQMVELVSDFRRWLLNPTTGVPDTDELVETVQGISTAAKALEDATKASAYAAAYARAVAFLSSAKRTMAAMVPTSKATFEACLRDYEQQREAMAALLSPKYTDELHSTRQPVLAAARLLAGDGGAAPAGMGNLGFTPNPALAKVCASLYGGPPISHNGPVPVGAAAKTEETAKCLGHAEAALFVKTMRDALGADFPDLSPGSSGTVADSVDKTYVVGAVSREPCSDACKISLVQFCKQLNAELLLVFPHKVRGQKRCEAAYIQFTAAGFQRLA